MPRMNGRADAVLTAVSPARQRRQHSVSAVLDAVFMTHDACDPIGAALEDGSDEIAALVLVAVRARDPEGLDRVGKVAETSRDRQVVEIARAHLRGDAELVDALARDHLVDYPDSLVVAWIASDAVFRVRREGNS
jgi:hypothetical protein